MSITKDQIIEAVAAMSVMDVVELVSAMEEKFGVSAAAASTIPDPASVNTAVAPATGQFHVSELLLLIRRPARLQLLSLPPSPK